MANKTKPVTKSTDGSESTETVQVAAPTSLTSEQFTQLLDIAKSLGATAAEPDDDDSDDEDEPVTKGMFNRFKAEIKKAKLSVDEKVMEALKAAFGAAEDDEDEDEGKKPKGKKAKTAKVKADEGEESVDEFTARALDAFGTAIAKAKKFTPKRAETMKDSISKLVGLLAELTDEETVKEAFGASGISVNGTGTTPTPGMAQNHGTGGPGSPGNSIVAKSVDGDALAAIISAAVEKAVAPLQATIENQAKELTEIKKSRQAPTGGGGDETERPVQKSGSMWGGVL